MRSLTLFVLLFAQLVFALPAHAITPKEFFKESLYAPANLVLEALSFDDRYRLGDEWGKKPVTEEDLKSNEHFRRMALATAKVRGGGTGFYIGEYNGEYVMATNHHVCEDYDVCSGSRAINFTQIGFVTKVNRFYGSWPEIDLALFSIVVDSEEKKTQLNLVASPFAFAQDLYRGQKLLTIGYGIANNDARVMVANQDSDCVVFSGDAEYRFMGDPDEINPAPYDAWSFASGCDVSHGDSGSAMMDRETGQVIGIIWTGRIPKSEKVQTSQYLQELLKTPTEEIWEELSYGVPAVKMKSYLTEQIANGAVADDIKVVLEKILQ